MRLLIALLLVLVAIVPGASAIQHMSHLCSGPQPVGTVSCNAEIAPLAHDHTAPYGFSPQQIRKAYNLPDTPPASAPHQTIAIVDAYAHPDIEHDLAVYSEQFGLPPCPLITGCLRVVDQRGGSTLPQTDPGWATEIALDVEITHGICPTCSILLVETDGPSYANMAAGVRTAAAMGATEISNSYGGREDVASEGFADARAAYIQPGIAVVASSGDNGYGVEFPASVGDVVAVGGTSLLLDDDGSNLFELAWKDAGSGCAIEYAPRWQSHIPGRGRQTGCGAHRSIADVSAVADPYTGASIYDSIPDESGIAGWWEVGGTSLSAPIIASVYALAGGVKPGIYAPSVVYRKGHRNLLTDVYAGSNGKCHGTSICTAGLGLDGPTGLGSPNGVTPFTSRRQP